jgi:UDP-glucose 4-epimerase
MGRAVVVLDDLSGGFRRNVSAACELVCGSVEDAATVDALFERHRFEHVYHLAAYAAEGLSHFVRSFNYRTNLLGSVNVINAAVRWRTSGFVFASSIAVYGEGPPPFREEQAGAPRDPYGVSKLAVEQDLACARETFGLRSIVFRPHNVYGDRQNLADPHRNVVGIFMRQALAGRACTIFGDGRQRRAFSWVGDVAPLIARSVETPAAWGRTFNIGADEPVPVLELAERVQRALGVRTGVEHLPARHELAEVFADHSRVREVFGFRSSVRLDEGLVRMARWARDVGIRPPRSVAPIEVRRGLPSAWA